MTETINLEALELADRLRPALLRINRRLRNELRSLGVTPTQISLLAAIRKQPGIGLTDLAAREEMTTASLCVHIDRLEAAELVARSRSAEGDRRRIGLHITPQGEELLTTIRSRRTVWLAERLATLDPTDLAAIDAAIEPLQRLLEAGS